MGGKGIGVGVTTRVVGGVGAGTGMGMGDSSGDEDGEMEELRRIESLPPGVVSVETRTVQVLGSNEEGVVMRGGEVKEEGIIEEIESVSEKYIGDADIERGMSLEEQCQERRMERESTEDLFPRVKE